MYNRTDVCLGGELLQNLSMKQNEKYAYWLMLQDVPGIGPGKIKQMYDKFYSIENIIHSLLNEDYRSEWAQKAKITIENNDLRKYLENIEFTYSIGGKLCSLEDKDYPRNLKKSSTPPPILFYKGHLENLSDKSLALVGTVDPTEDGLKRARKFAKLCTLNGIQVISGLARGVDTESHRTTLINGGITYAVVAYGIDHCYPPENKELFDEIIKKGAVISQFQTGTKPLRWMFPARNETMCTLSMGTVIIEAEEGCGSLIQARYSFKHQRRVFLLNSNLNDNQKWASNLIENGALVVKDFEVIKKEMEMIDNNFVDNLLQEQITIDISQKSSKAFLFDLDGVLYDSINIIKETYKSVVMDMKNKLSDEDLLVINTHYNNAPTYVFNLLNLNPEKGHQSYKTKYLSSIKNEVKFFDKIDNIIMELNNKGYVIGIVTSQPLSRYNAIIDKATFKDYIKVAVTWNDVPKGKQKPDPFGILKALEKVNINPQNSVYIGDDPKDILAAKKAGAHSAAALWGTGNKELLYNSNPDYSLEKVEELLNIRI